MILLLTHIPLASLNHCCSSATHSESTRFLSCVWELRIAHNGVLLMTTRSWHLMIAHVRPLLRNRSPHLLIVLTHLRQAHHLNLMKLVIHTLYLNKALNIISKKSKTFLSIKNKYYKSTIINIDELHGLTLKELKKNPYFLIKNEK